MERTRRSSRSKAKTHSKKLVFSVLKLVLSQTVHFAFFVVVAIPIALLIEDNVLNGRVLVIASWISLVTLALQHVLERFLATHSFSDNQRVVFLVGAKALTLITCWGLYFAFRPDTIDTARYDYVDSVAARQFFILALIVAVPIDALFTKLIIQVQREIEQAKAS